MNIKEVIELIEKYIADPKSVSQRELRAACDAAYDAAYSDASWYAWCAVRTALPGDIDGTKRWVAKYQEIIKENV